MVILFFGEWFIYHFTQVVRRSMNGATCIWVLVTSLLCVLFRHPWFVTTSYCHWPWIGYLLLHSFQLLSSQLAAAVDPLEAALRGLHEEELLEGLSEEELLELQDDGSKLSGVFIGALGGVVFVSPVFTWFSTFALLASMMLPSLFCTSCIVRSDHRAS